MEQAVLDPLGDDAMLIIQLSAKGVCNEAGEVDLSGFINRALHILEDYRPSALRLLTHFEIIKGAVY